MYSVEKYILQTVPKPLFSQWFMEVMLDDGAIGFKLERDYTQRGAKLILLHRIVFLTGNAATAPLAVFDNFNRPVFIFQETTSMNGIYNLGLIIESPTIKLTAPGSVGYKVGILVHYQYIYNQESMTQPQV